MDRGRLAEFASPAELLRDHKTKFYSVRRVIHIVVTLMAALQGHRQNRIQKSQDHGGKGGAQTQRRDRIERQIHQEFTCYVYICYHLQLGIAYSMRVRFLQCDLLTLQFDPAIREPG